MNGWKKSTFLGKGTHGSVVLATKDDKVIAVKTTNIDERWWCYESLKQEQIFLKELIDEPYVVRCFGTDESLENGIKTYSLLLEYAGEGDLDDLLREIDPGRMEEIRIARLTRMLLTALSNIHARGIIHRDLRPKNILVFPAADGHPEQVKIADFGLADLGLPPEKTTFYPESESPEKAEVNLNKGTLLYSSPETVTRGEYGAHTDIWSLGIIVAEMMDPGDYFFDPDEDLYDQIVHKPLELWKLQPFYSITAIDFLAKCLDRNPATRWSARKLLKHPFITGNLKDTLIAAGDDHQMKAENPIEPSTDWLESYGLFTTDEDEELPPWMQILDGSLLCFDHTLG